MFAFCGTHTLFHLFLYICRCNIDKMQLMQRSFSSYGHVDADLNYYVLRVELFDKAYNQLMSKAPDKSKSPIRIPVEARKKYEQPRFHEETGVTIQTVGVVTRNNLKINTK